jgi:hypothetical protein
MSGKCRRSSAHFPKASTRKRCWCGVCGEEMGQLTARSWYCGTCVIEYRGERAYDLTGEGDLVLNRHAYIIEERRGTGSCNTAFPTGTESAHA